MAEENPFARLFNRASSTVVQLAVLEPGEKSAPLTLSLINADPTDTTYQCISYDRSKDFGTSEVTLLGHATSVPKPLEAALRAIRREDRPSHLWADLLIGDGAEERSKQASVMKTVLENAEKTIVWLEPAEDQTSAAFDILRTLSNRWQQASLHAGLPPSVTKSTQKQMLDLFAFLRSKSTDHMQPGNEAAWKIVARLFGASYFHTVQSIPEILLSKKAVLTSGDKSISWTDFMNASRAAPFVMAQQLGMTVGEEQMEGFSLIASMEIAERRRREDGRLELLPLIHSSRDCSTADPREFVFSMLPVCNPSQGMPFPTADYTKTVQQVFTEAARYSFHERQDLLPWWCERPPRGRKVTGLPSWVPDWSSPLPKNTAKVLPVKSNGMRAWWDHIVPSRKRISVDDGNALHVQAHALDRVISVSPIFTQENCRRLCLSEWQALPTQPGETADAKMQKMFRTLILNQSGMGETMRDNAEPDRDMWVSFQSVLAEEQILELMGCTVEQMMADPALTERAKANPDCAVLGPETGRSQWFEEWLRKNAIGRRFFRTEGGRTGMTAVEILPEGAGPAAGQPPAPDFDNVMGDPMARMMLEAFQDHLRQRNPEMANVLSNGLDGTLPGQAPPGVRSNDLVVALVGGFQPYVLHPATEHTAPGESAAQSLEAVSRYTYVGDCYLHGVMNGEPFKVKRWFGNETWKTDVKLVDIAIV